MSDINTQLFFAIYNLANHNISVDNIMVFTANYLIYITFIVILLWATLGKQKGWSANWRTFFLAVASIIISLLIVKIIRIFYFEPRPFINFGITPLTNGHSDASFPSTHTTTLAAIAFTYLFQRLKITYLLLFFTLFTGLARIYVGVHYPFDILGGLVVGFSAAGLIWVVKRLTS